MRGQNTRDRLPESIFPTCEYSSDCRSRNQPWPERNISGNTVTNLGTDAREQRMRHAQMQIFDELHVVTRHNNACVAHCEHTSPRESGKSDGDAAGLPCYP